MMDRSEIIRAAEREVIDAARVMVHSPGGNAMRSLMAAQKRLDDAMRPPELLPPADSPSRWFVLSKDECPLFGGVATAIATWLPSENHVGHWYIYDPFWSSDPRRLTPGDAYVAGFRKVDAVAIEAEPEPETAPAPVANEAPALHQQIIEPIARKRKMRTSYSDQPLLTEEFIARTHTPGSYRDGNSNLTLKIENQRSKAYQVRFKTTDGRNDSVGIGSAFKMTIDQARIVAAKIDAESKLGIYPKKSRSTNRFAVPTNIAEVAPHIATISYTNGEARH